MVVPILIYLAINAGKPSKVGWGAAMSTDTAFALGLLALVAVALAVPIFVTFVEEGLVPRLPTALLSTGLMILAFLAVACGMVLDTVTRGRREMKMLAYLAQKAPGDSPIVQPEETP